MTHSHSQTGPEDQPNLEEDRLRDLRERVQKGNAEEDSRPLLEKLAELRARALMRLQQLQSAPQQQVFYVGQNAYFGGVPGSVPVQTGPVPMAAPLPPAPQEKGEQPLFSRFNFSQLDPEKSGLMDPSQRVPVTKRELQRMRDQAAADLTSFLKDRFGILTLREFPAFGDSYGVRDFLVNEGFFEGRVNPDSPDLDVLTANVLVLQQAISAEKGVLQAQGGKLVLAPGKSLVFYMKAGSATAPIIAYRQREQGPLEPLNPQY